MKGIVSLFRLNTVLLVLFLAVLIGAWAMPRHPTRRNLELMPDMQYSPAYHAYSVNPNFANGQTLRSAPEETIARGEVVLHYSDSKEDAIRAGEELTSPVDHSDPKALAAGQQVYRIFCAMCHGREGHGDGPVTKRGYPPPPSLLKDKSVTMKDDQLFHIVTYGQAGMAPYASQIAPRDRWLVIAYVRDMQAKAAMDPNVEDGAESLAK